MSMMDDPPPCRLCGCDCAFGGSWCPGVRCAECWRKHVEIVRLQPRRDWLARLFGAKP